MGYSALYASLMHRNLLSRIDDESKHLSDGFSWSILFLNDNSSICKQFLKTYARDLSLRTGDRIRFIFFSDENINNLQVNEQTANPDSLLSKIKKLATGWLPPPNYDQERNPWETFRPEGIQPLDTEGKFKSYLNFDDDPEALMPGAGEAQILAHKLGIGRFVPCFIFFSDIGTLVIRLLPFGKHSPKDIYIRLRNLIDTYYEQNKANIAEWSRMEAEIEQKCEAFRTPIREISNWKNSVEKEWEELKAISDFAVQLQKNDADPGLLQKLFDSYNLPHAVRDHALPFLKKLSAIQQTKKDLTAAGKWMEGENAEAFRFSEFSNVFSSIIPAALKIKIDTLDQLSREPRFRSLQLEIYQWWRFIYRDYIGRNSFNQFRTAWAAFSKPRFSIAMPGHNDSSFTNEYQLVNYFLTQQKTDAEPEICAGNIINGLARALDVSVDNKEWLHAVQRFRDALIWQVGILQRRMPAELMAIIKKNELDYSWADCIPHRKKFKEMRSEECLIDFPQLFLFVEEADKKRLLEFSDFVDRRPAEIMKLRTETMTEIRDLYPGTETTLVDERAVWDALISSLLPFRKILEEKVFQTALNNGSKKYPGQMYEKRDGLDLLRRLDEYERITALIAFPFENDHELLAIRGSTSVFETGDFRELKEDRGRINYLKNKFEDALSDTATSSKDWLATQTAVSFNNPGGQMISSLKAIIPDDRWKELLIRAAAGTSLELIAKLSSKQKIVEFLHLLDVYEVMKLEQSLNPGAKNYKKAPDTKEAIFDSILSAIHLMPDIAEKLNTTTVEAAAILKEKVRRGTFDVFLAHNSADRQTTLKLGDLLRSKGIYPWIDDEQVPPGRWFQDVLQSAIRTVRCAAILIGEQGMGKWQKLELSAFISRCLQEQMVLIPVLLPGVKKIPEDLVFLNEMNCIEFPNDIFDREAMDKLAWGITNERPFN